MNRFSALLLLFVFLSCTGKKLTSPEDLHSDALVYVVDLNDREDDTFKVTLFVDNLKTENNIFQFAASAPGTYRTMDMGRYVRDFYALNINGDTLRTEQISVNQWLLSDVQNIRQIIYKIAETWDTPVDSNYVYVMCGTSLEQDHALINGQAVFGFPAKMQQRPIKFRLEYPESWLAGTALSKTNDGYYFAKNYDEVVDSPVLLGRLTSAGINVNGTEIDVFCYSRNDIIKADEILTSADDILTAADKFLEGLPVKRYAFLFHFEDKDAAGAGAWEHNYSSFYAFPEPENQDRTMRGLPGVMAHEFFHIITPLHIHSELIEHFNFEKPQPSEHLWLYEGTTEWAAIIMQLRGGLISLSEYLDRISKKLTISNQRFRSDYSLRELSLNSFSVKGQKEYGNIYMRGAVTAGLLDLRLLELSGGQRGLREVILQLIDIYGTDKSFDEKNFFQTFTDLTYPEIADFFNSYVVNANPLPLKEYYSFIGIDYQAEVKTGENDTTAGWALSVNDQNQFVFFDVDPQVEAMGIHEGDVLFSINNEELSMQNVRQLYNQIKKLPIDSTFILKFKSGEKVKEESFNRIIREKTRKHVFTMMENADSSQIKLRNAWVRNL
ncbi:MAG: peptidase [Calditrichaeota bacterium]|nr:peptidase [Calditrichota bacterium]